MTNGKIIFLNGPSSAGKTAIIKELQPILKEPFLHVGVDMFYRMMPLRYFGKDPSEDDPAHKGFRWRTITEGERVRYDLTPGPIGYQMLEGMQSAIAAMASVGNNIIVDENVIYEGQMEGYLKALREYYVLFIGVFCALEEIERRELERGDRRVGHARGHYHLSHKFVEEFGSYDLCIDTTARTPRECAEMIAHHYLEGPPPTAFRALHASLFQEGG